ncbi:conserved protein of unknown function [Bradyrhizobium sp. ORS 285]|uniref:HvfC/BufC N-terminal domain-containing protein n=1 Tax=Bradyrhizobium sp. ORS 285 TaxID=115808 RepID=UPI0002406D7A|nr:DNA-binding domain-containing protein [Bradyrhizobium sp. ORS 285]CCD87255.1 conserved hypothetical protein [Bradyrhizobium sp. ORS 285]SMX57984.1 conserved protein of unknown function [Bradyrhizobium sp. ORS 285]
MQPDEPTNFAASFAAGLLAPGAAVPVEVAGPGGRPAGRRYDVYRNNITVSLVNALAAIYPAVQRITGEEFFREMARSHLRQTPPTSPLLFAYGHGFAEFIAAYPHAAELPWLADVARIERAWLDAYHAADAASLAPAALSTIPPERLAEAVFIPHPSTRLVRSRFAAVTIFAANRTDQPTGRIDASAAEDALVVRPEFDVEVRRLPPGGALFVASLIEGQPLGEAAASALDAEPQFDIATNIAGLIESGAFTSVTSGPAQ